MPCDTCNILLKTAEAKQSSPSGGKVLAGLLVVGGILAVVAIAAAASRNS